MSGRRRRTIASRRELFEEAAAIIAFEYADALALDEVAQRLFTSPRQLQRAFAEVGQTSFRTYLRRVRMERAEELLRTGSLNVSHVAAAVGYRQPAQFAKAFKHHHGYAPSAIRASASFRRPSRLAPLAGANRS